MITEEEMMEEETGRRRSSESGRHRVKFAYGYVTSVFIGSSYSPIPHLLFNTGSVFYPYPVVVLLVFCFEFWMSLVNILCCILVYPSAGPVLARRLHTTAVTTV